jgi:DNA-binding response OmpR family regulator
VLVELRRGDHRRQRRGSGLEREQQHYDGRQRGRERGTVDAKAGHSADAKYLLQMAEGSARILLVDDEESVQTLLAYPLRKDGFEVVAAGNGREALDRFAEQRFDLVVLDIMLPGVDGIEVCRRMRSRSQVPIIMLTAKDDEIDKVLGLEMGADDYITKPFSVREFRSRVRATLRRAEMLGGRPGTEEPIVAGGLRMDFERRIVTMREEPTRLTYVEFEILAALARSPGRVQTREMLLEQVWGDAAYRDPRTIDVHIRHLREKLERDPRAPEYLFTVRGVGYRFRDSDE